MYPKNKNQAVSRFLYKTIQQERVKFECLESAKPQKFQNTHIMVKPSLSKYTLDIKKIVHGINEIK